MRRGNSTASAAGVPVARNPFFLSGSQVRRDNLARLATLEEETNVAIATLTRQGAVLAALDDVNRAYFIACFFMLSQASVFSYIFYSWTTGKTSKSGSKFGTTSIGSYCSGMVVHIPGVPHVTRQLDKLTYNPEILTDDHVLTSLFRSLPERFGGGHPVSVRYMDVLFAMFECGQEGLIGGIPGLLSKMG